MTSYTVSGLVATSPRHIVTTDGLPITSFRLAVWGDPDTNWFTVTGYKSLAINLATSISKGDRVVVSGSLRVRDWDNGERAGTAVEIEAVTVGHDLAWGQSTFVRTVQVSGGDVINPEEDSE